MECGTLNNQKQENIKKEPKKWKNNVSFVFQFRGNIWISPWQTKRLLCYFLVPPSWTTFAFRLSCNTLVFSSGTVVTTGYTLVVREHPFSRRTRCTGSVSRVGDGPISTGIAIFGVVMSHILDTVVRDKCIGGAGLASGSRDSCLILEFTKTTNATGVNSGHKFCSSRAKIAIVG